MTFLFFFHFVLRPPWPEPEPKTIARAGDKSQSRQNRDNRSRTNVRHHFLTFFVGQVQRLPAQEQLMETRAAVAADPCTRSRYLPGLLLVSYAVLRVRTLIAVPYNTGSIRILIAVPDNTGSIRTLIAVRTKLVPSILIWPSVLRLQWWKRFNICKRLSYS